MHVFVRVMGDATKSVDHSRMIVEVLSIYLTIIMASTVLLLLLIVMAACLQQYATQPIIMEGESRH